MNESLTSKEGFVGSRPHVALCLAWFCCVVAFLYHLEGVSPILALSLPFGLGSLVFGHLFFFAIRYVLTGRSPDGF